MRLLIVEDHPVFRRGLKQILSEEPEVKLVTEAETAAKALQLVRKQRWDVVLLDINLPGKSGLDLLQDLKRECPKLPVLVLSVHPEDRYALRTLKAGAAGYLTKEKAPEEIMRAIRKVAQGGRYVTESLAEQMAFNLESPGDKAGHEKLSDREYEVLRLVATGKTPREIAAALRISTRTVSTYRARVLEKLKLKNNSELMRYAMDHRLVE